MTSETHSTEQPTAKAGYTPAEMMIVAASRALAGTRTVFVGIGLPNIACNLARYTVAPDLELIYEAGMYGARPDRLPLSIGDPSLVTGALSVVSHTDLFGLFLQGGLVEVAMLGGAQIDRFGNLNTTVIGPYEQPKVRLPGSGGACEIATNAQRTFMVMRLKRRAFVSKLDFITSPGYLEGGDARQRLGIETAGPELVITDLALFDFGGPDHEMRLTSLHAGVTVEDVRAEVGWPIAVAESVAATRPPDDEELRLMRDVLDPQAIYRG
jgi:glutaconate CoA-transferase, subunit B